MLNCDNDLFESASFFMFRSPILPKDHYEYLLKSSNVQDYLLQFYLNNATFREALLVASPSLYRQLLKNKKSPKVLKSLLKYFIRATTRTTPFGLFSFVGIGHVGGKQTDVSFQENQIIKRIRPDIAWLSKFVDSLSEAMLRRGVPLHKKSLTYCSKGKIWLKYLENMTTGLSTNRASISNNVLVENIMKYTKKSISYSELEELIKKEIPSLNCIKFERIILSLIKQQFLALEAKPSLLTESALEDLILQYPNSILLSLKNEFAKYNLLPLGFGEEQLQILNNKMEAREGVQSNTAKSNNQVFQIDSFCKNAKNLLSSKISSELTSAASVLWKISHATRKQHPLASYHNKFLQRYGTNRLIPLMELLDPNSGIGVPNHFGEMKFSNSSPLEGSNKFDNYLKSIFSNSLYNSGCDIEITDKDVAHLCSQYDEEKIPPSCDLLFEISSKEAVSS